MHSEKPNKLPFLILLFLISFAAVGASLFTPALPAIRSFFNLSAGEEQLTMTIYLLGYAIGQLPYGPLANRFGRKVTLYIGISLAIAGSLLCALSAPLESFKFLIAARFIQALGGSVGLKVSFTMIADVYTQMETTRVISRILIAFAVMPGIAIAIGGWLTQWFHWESCFYFLALFGAFVLFLSTKMAETAKSLDPRALDLSSILRGYGLMFKNRKLMICGLMWGCASSVLYIFTTKAPYIGINIIGLSPEMFGIYNLIPVSGILIGSILSYKLTGRYSTFTLLIIGIIGSFASTLTMFIPFGLGIVNGWSLFFPMFLIFTTLFPIVAHISSYGLANAQDKSNASAVMNFINLSTTVVAIIFSQLIYPDSALLMPLSFVVAFSLMLLLWIGLRSVDSAKLDNVIYKKSH
jgi:multidrug resistance protein